MVKNKQGWGIGNWDKNIAVFIQNDLRNTKALGGTFCTSEGVSGSPVCLGQNE